jgi:hypothetical protein
MRKADRVEPRTFLEMKLLPLYREYSNFIIRLPKRTDIFMGTGDEDKKIIKPRGKTCQAPSRIDTLSRNRELFQEGKGSPVHLAYLFL